MALSHSPSIITNGLVLCLDAANLKSFKGVNATNVLNSITYNQSNQSSATYRVTNGEESVYIPSLGVVTSKYVDFYNDGSVVCCPSLYTYGTGLSVSPNTTYTYSIIYKTTSGYSHPNYMYRYEYASNGAYAGEAGVHSTSNRTSLGDGWWFAWGQFTTSATTATLNTFLFHYEYGTQNRVYVYRAALYQGTYIISPQHILTPGQVRGTTVTTGGGWVDLSGTGNHGELVNGVSYDSSNGGSLVFDGLNDRINLEFSPTLDISSSITMEGFIYPTAYKSGGGGGGMIITKTASYYTELDGSSGKIRAYFYGLNSPGYHSGNAYVPLNTWTHYAVVRDSTSNSIIFYINGNLDRTISSITGSITVQQSYPVTLGSYVGSNYEYTGRIASGKIYNRALTALEIEQNFNALRGRYGI
jgi:hypothetical protein